MSGRTSDKRWKGKALKNAQSKHECRDGVQSGRRLGWVATVNRAARLVGVENRAQELPGERRGCWCPWPAAALVLLDCRWGTLLWDHAGDLSGLGRNLGRKRGAGMPIESKAAYNRSV